MSRKRNIPWSSSCPSPLKGRKFFFKNFFCPGSRTGAGGAPGDSCPALGVRPKYRKKSSFLVIYLHYGTEAVRNGQDTNNAIRPLLEEHAKKCYLTWQYIDMNDGKLLQDDLKTFDDWKQSSGCISTSVGSYPRMTYPSPTFHTTVFALSGVVI